VYVGVRYTSQRALAEAIAFDLRDAAHAEHRMLTRRASLQLAHEWLSTHQLQTTIENTQAFYERLMGVRPTPKHRQEQNHE
jgi:hypothetical protein